MNLKLNDKIVVITGATGGIGQYITLDFLREGAIPVLLYRNEDKLKNLKEWLAEQVGTEGRIFAYNTSITDTKSITEVVKKIIAAHGQIDVLVNCAGFAVEAPFLMLDEEAIERMLDVNLRSPLYLSKAVLRYMMRKKSGNIINISSASTHVWGRGIAVYASAKAGLERLTQTLAQEVGKKKVRINAVCPGVIATEMSTNLRSVAEEIILTSTALQKYGIPQEVAKSVLFLASEETASFITGHVLNVDGGLGL